jgi:hypothetical protein
MTSPNETIIKSDTRGRVRVSLERREALLDEFEGSALSALKFSQLAGVKYPTFANWVSKRRKARAAQGPSAQGTADAERAKPVRLFEAFAEIGGAGRANAGLSIELPGGARVQVDSPLQVRLAAELLRMLGTGGARAC